MVGHSTAVGRSSRHWCHLRKLSQLDLVLQADISARVLSFIETGKSHPGREFISRLAKALQLPLRQHNLLLIAAGYAPDGRRSFCVRANHPAR